MSVQKHNDDMEWLGDGFHHQPSPAAALPISCHHLGYCFSLPAQQCSEGWSQVGDACLRINSSLESYDNAQHYCKNLNGNIASLTTSKQVDFVLEELNKLQLQDKVKTIANQNALL